MHHGMRRSMQRSHRPGLSRGSGGGAARGQRRPRWRCSGRSAPRRRPPAPPEPPRSRSPGPPVADRRSGALPERSAAGTRLAAHGDTGRGATPPACAVRSRRPRVAGQQDPAISSVVGPGSAERRFLWKVAYASPTATARRVDHPAARHELQRLDRAPRSQSSGDVEGARAATTPEQTCVRRRRRAPDDKRGRPAGAAATAVRSRPGVAASTRARPAEFGPETARAR